MLLKNKPRNQYKLADGTLVPGVTTVLAELNKPALLRWAWQNGKDGVEWPIPLDGTAGVGTICHYKIACMFNHEKEEYDPKWDKAHIELGAACYQRFVDYYDSRCGSGVDDPLPILSEYSSVHEKQRYGGTLDLLVETKDGIELWDIKTSKAIYEEYYIQLAAYKMLLDQDSRFRHLEIRPRVILVPKEGGLEAPLPSKAYMKKARNSWEYLIKFYHKLQAFRNDRQGAMASSNKARFMRPVAA